MFFNNHIFVCQALWIPWTPSLWTPLIILLLSGILYSGHTMGCRLMWKTAWTKPLLYFVLFDMENYSVLWKFFDRIFLISTYSDYSKLVIVVCFGSSTCKALLTVMCCSNLLLEVCLGPWELNYNSHQCLEGFQYFPEPSDFHNQLH